MNDDVSLTTYIDAEQLKSDVAIDPADLNGAMIKHAATYTHYAVQAVRAQRQYDRWKMAVEVLEAQLDAEYRQKAAEEAKKVTEGAIAASVMNDARMKAAKSRMLDAKQMKDLCDAATMCFVHRRDMLLQLGRDAVAERAGQLRVSAPGAVAGPGYAAAAENLREGLQDMASRAASA